LPDARFSRDHLLTALLDFVEDAILCVSLDGRIETWSAGAERLYGYAPSEAIGRSLSLLLPLYELPQLGLQLQKNGSSRPSRDAQNAKDPPLRQFARTGEAEAHPIELSERLHKNGSRLLVALQRRHVRADSGEAVGILEMARRLDFHEATWFPQEAPLRLLMEQAPGFLWTTDRNLKICTHWGNGLPAATIRTNSLVGQSVCHFFGSADRHSTPLAEHCDALRGMTSHFEHAWKSSVLEIRVGPLRSGFGEIIGCLGAAVDITHRKHSEEQALYQARHDALTGLANYREFIERLELEVHRAERSHRSFTLLLLDLDGLKRINDLQGHLAGNRALRRLAAVMNEHCRSTDLAARYGGDEFAVVLIDSDRGMAENVAQRIERRLRADSQPPLGVSIGIGVYPDDGRTAAELIEAADQRLYHRKKTQEPRIVAAT